jgi:hypothetical protein
MNRLLTTLIQLALLGVVIPLVYITFKDIKENGLLPDED